MPSIDQIFKAYDIRGKVGSELNPEVLKRVGQALGQWLPNSGKVAVGRDMRPDSKELASAIIDGLVAQGRDVVDIGEVTSDMIYFAVGGNGLAGGAMITASHNPGEYNGIKFCREGAKPIGEESGLSEIRDLAKANQFVEAEKKGTVEKRDIVEDWINHALSFIDLDKLKPLKLAVDAGNGMAGKIFPDLEPYVPFEVIEMFFELDGTFPNHIANPLILENLADLQKMVRENGSDVGVAFDGDGDRAVLIDEKGQPLSGTVMTAMLAEYFLKKNPGATILINAICGQAAVDAIENAGGKVIRTRVGHSFIKSDMRKYNAVFAGEHSGHYYFKDNYMADSGLIAALIGLYILSSSNKPLSKLAEPFRKSYIQIQETNFEVQDKEKTIKDISENFKDHKQDWLDGLTVKFSDGWFNIRPSNTEPLIRFNAEAKNKDSLDKIVVRVTELIKKAS
jgi:phosphomannomutase